MEIVLFSFPLSTIYFCLFSGDIVAAAVDLRNCFDSVLVTMLIILLENMEKSYWQKEAQSQQMIEIWWEEIDDMHCSMW